MLLIKSLILQNPFPLQLCQGFPYLLAALDLDFGYLPIELPITQKGGPTHCRFGQNQSQIYSLDFVVKRLGEPSNELFGKTWDFVPTRSTPPHRTLKLTER